MWVSKGIKFESSVCKQGHVNDHISKGKSGINLIQDTD